MSFRCFRLLGAIGRQYMIYYVSEKCSGKVLDNKPLKHAKPVWNGWEGASKDRFEASFCGTVIVHCCCVMLLLVSCFMKPGFVRSFRIDCLKAAIIDFITKAGSEDRCPSRVLLHLSSLVLSGQLVKKHEKATWDMYGAGMLVFVQQIEEIGGKFVDPPTFDIAKSYADSALRLQKVLNQMKHGLKQETSWRSCTVEVV